MPFFPRFRSGRTGADRTPEEPVPQPAGSERPAADPFDLDRIGRIPVKVYAERQGLPSQLVMALAVDREGRLWAGTDAGLSHYNGRVWTEMPLPAEARTRDIRSIHVGLDGSLWIGTIQGLLRLANGRWAGVGDSNATVSLKGLEVQDCLEVSDGGMSELWLATRKGLHRLANGHWTAYDTSSGLPSDVVWRLLATRDGRGRLTILAATNDGIARFVYGENRGWSTFATAGPDGLPDPKVWCLLETTGRNGGKVLLAGTSGGLARYEDGRWSVVDTSDGLPHNWVWCLAETVDPDGSRVLWAGTWGGGLGRFARGRWRTLKGGFPDPIDGQVWCLLDMTASNGSRGLWAGTGGGVARIGAGAWSTIDVSAALPGACPSSFLEVAGESGTSTLWMGTTTDGVLRLEDGRWSAFDTDAGLPHNSVGTVAGRRTPVEHVVWAATLGGVARFDGDKFEPLEDTTGASRKIVCAMEAPVEPGEAFWVAMDIGLGRLDHGGLTPWPLPPEVPVRYVAVAETESARGARVLWLGTRSRGLVRVADPPGGRFDVLTAESSGLPSDEVLFLRQFDEADGRRFLWVGMTSGLAWRDLGDDDAPWGVLTASTTPSLPGGAAYRVERDARGRFYVMTLRGITRYASLRPLSSDPSAFTAHTYTTEDGLPSLEGNFGASMVDSLGRIWFGTAAGPAIFDPELETDDLRAKPLALERVTIDGEQCDLRARRTLSWRENNLELEFALLSYFREDDTRYRSQLVGFDREPTEWTSDCRRIYTNLPARDYIFRVWGRDYAGNVSDPVEVAFRIRAAPWKSWGAYLLYTGAAAGAAYAGVRYRVGALERRGRELEALVERRTAELSESEQRALDANRSKSVFLANMSHELRTPLNAVLGFAQLLDRDPSLADRHREHLEIIQQAGEHLLGLINDVLSISKIEAGRLALDEHSFDLRRVLDAVERIARVRADAKGIDLAFAPDPDLPRTVRGDEGKLRQVLLNLLANAVKFTERGSVVVRVRGDGEAPGRVTFEVADSGPGIAPEEIAHLFEPFAQTQSGRALQEGTGLGLAISRQIVRLMGGDILVQSVLGRGTTFRVDVALPAVEGVAETAPAPRVLGLVADAEPPRILVADDGRENRLLLVKLLSEVGFAVREASDGRDAVAEWEAWRPDLIFMDMRMPVMGGREATRRIRAREAELRRPSSSAPGPLPPQGQRTRIIALTASAFEHERDEILACGADDFVTKPFREQALFDTLARHLGVRYAKAEVATEAAPGHGAGVLTVERLSALPTDLVVALREAVNTGDVDEASRIVETLGGSDERVAQALLARIREYKIDELYELLGETGTE
jgi:signal transduction histidine kinase/CheY-like chemotaxis protein/ligand-binding sensor domain-containing protein